jgi:hypothetical protein
MSAGKSANKHLALDEWKRKMQSTFRILNKSTLHRRLQTDAQFLAHYNPKAQLRAQMIALDKFERGLMGPRMKRVRQYYTTIVGGPEECGDFQDEILWIKDNLIQHQEIRQYYTGDVNRAIGQIL